MQVKRTIIRFLTIVLFLCMIPVSVQSQTDFNKTSINLKLASGYDDNPLFISQVNDSIKTSLFNQKIGSQIKSIFNWSKAFRSSFIIDGEYSIFPNKTDINEWHAGIESYNIAKLYPKYKKSWLPGVYLFFGVDVSFVDQLFTDRLYGEEFESSVTNGEKIKMGDLLDRSSFDFFTGFRFKISKNSYFTVRYTNAINNYNDLGSKQNNSFISLDNNENKLSNMLYLKLTDFMDLTLQYSIKNKLYDYRLAKDLNKNEIFDVNREYYYYTLGFSTILKYEKAVLELGYAKTDRDDQFEGYYNYQSGSIKGKLAYRLNSKLRVVLRSSLKTKLYSNLEFSNIPLENDYLFHKISLQYKIFNNLTISPSFIYDKETSTYYKFSYTREIAVLDIRYKLYNF